MTGLHKSNKSWKPLFIRMTYPNGFGIDLRWRVAKAGGNRVLELTRVEQADLKKIDRHVFSQTLELDQGELDRFWPSTILPNANPPITFSIDPEFQIGEPSQAGFTFQGIFTLYTF